MPNQRISSCWDFASRGNDAATATTKAVKAKRRIDVLGSNDSKTVKHNQPANSTSAGDSSLQALRPTVDLRSIADLQGGEVLERPQRYPYQQQRADEYSATYDVHHLLTPDFTDDGADFRGGDELAQAVIFEAL